MKKEVSSFVFVFLMILSAGVLAQEVDVSDAIKSIDEDVEKFVKGFINRTGIDEGKVENVSKVDQDSLPDNLQIKEISENNLGIYEVNYEESNSTKKLFVVTYATNKLKEKSSIIKNIQSLHFGSLGGAGSSYLETSTGVLTGSEVGYVMLREGSITGISTSLNLEGEGSVYLRVYRNGEDTGLHNIISVSDNRKIDYDLQSEDVVNYFPGDVISVYLESSGDVVWSNVVTMVETTS